MAFTSLVLGIASLLAWLIPFLGLPISIAGLILEFLEKNARSVSRAALPTARSKQFTMARRKPPGGIAC